MWPLQQRGLALATVLSAYLNVALLWAILWRSLRPPEGATRQLWGSLLRQLCVLTVTAAAIAAATRLPLPNLPGILLDRLAAFLLPAIAGAVAYLGGHLALRSPECREIFAVLGNRLPSLRRRRRL